MKDALFVYNNLAIHISQNMTYCPHSHHLIKIAISVDSKIKGRIISSGETFAHNTVIINPDVLHEMSCPGKIFCVWISPDNLENINSIWKTKKDTSRDFVSIESASILNEVNSIFEKELGSGSAYTIGKNIVELLVQQEKLFDKQVLDKRVIGMLDFIDENLAEKISITELSQQSYISASYAMALFRKNIGIPIRRYVKWRRIRKSIHLMAKGLSCKQIAHQVGFTDQAHLSNTFKSTLGFCPTLVVNRGSHIEICQESNFW